jgi:3-hexulose-6-phosphate synthase
MNRIDLQIALDVGKSESLIEIAHEVRPWVDWIEAGTPWITTDGLACVRMLRSTFPEKSILADLKIIDAGYYSASLAFEAGAHMTTVLGCASDWTISGVVKAARYHGCRVMVDMIQVANIKERSRQVLELGANWIEVHTGFDDLLEGIDPISRLAQLAGSEQLPIVAAGGINLEKIAQIALFSPVMVVVGRALTESPDPAQLAGRLRQELDRFG